MPALSLNCALKPWVFKISTVLRDVVISRSSDPVLNQASFNPFFSEALSS